MVACSSLTIYQHFHIGRSTKQLLPEQRKIIDKLHIQRHSWAGMLKSVRYHDNIRSESYTLHALDKIHCSLHAFVYGRETLFVKINMRTLA